MKRGLYILTTVGMVVFACSSNDQSQSADEISGVYVREYSFKVVNPGTSAEIGVRTIRDTIFIQPFERKYEISNHKWGKNTYDNDGWRNMEHAEDRPIPTLHGKYDSENRIVILDDNKRIYLLDSNSLSVGNRTASPFRRIK